MLETIVRKMKTGVGLVAIIGVPILTAYSYFIPDIITTKVTNTHIRDNGSSYLIYTNDGVFENSGAWYRGKITSDTIEQKIEATRGKDVTLTKYGWRLYIPLLCDKHENIVDVEEMPPLKLLF